MSPEVEDVVLRERYRMLATQLPRLHGIIIITIVPMAFALYGSVHWTISLVLPALVASYSSTRMRYWRRVLRAADLASVGDMKTAMRKSTIFTALCTFAVVATIMIGVQDQPMDEQLVCIMLVWIATVAGAFCMFALPSAAVSLLTAAAVPVVTHLALHGGTLYSTVSVLVGINTAVIGYVALQIGSSFTERTIMRVQIEQEQQRTAAARDQATRLANADALTGLANRRNFMAHLTERVRQPHSFAVALIDLDGFKPVNDTHGHAAGDEVLIEVGRRLSMLMEHRGLAARLGGDEFALVIEGVASHAAAAQFGRDVVRALALPYVLTAATVHISAGCGLTIGSGGDAPEQLLHDADAALYCSKGGTDAVTVHGMAEAEPPNGSAALSSAA